jgi:hypothetical protein
LDCRPLASQRPGTCHRACRACKAPRCACATWKGYFLRPPDACSPTRRRQQHDTGHAQVQESATGKLGHGRAQGGRFRLRLPRSHLHT